MHYFVSQKIIIATTTFLSASHVPGAQVIVLILKTGLAKAI